MQRPDFDPSLFKKQGFISPSFWHCQPPSCKGFITGARHTFTFQADCQHQQHIWHYFSQVAARPPAPSAQKFLQTFPLQSRASEGQLCGEQEKGKEKEEGREEKGEEKEAWEEGGGEEEEERGERRREEEELAKTGEDGRVEQK